MKTYIRERNDGVMDSIKGIIKMYADTMGAWRG